MRTAIIVSAFLISASILTNARAQTLVLNCTPEMATDVNKKDPITSISVRLEDGAAHIVHKAQSGKTYDRAEQYDSVVPEKRGSSFKWEGHHLEKPYLRMQGSIETSGGQYVYRERLFDEKIGRQSFEMQSACERVPVVAKVPPEVREVRSSTELFKEKLRMVDIMQDRLADCTEIKLMEFATAGERAEIMADSAMMACQEKVDDLVSAQLIQLGGGDRRDLRSSIRLALVPRALQVKANVRNAGNDNR